MIIRVERSVPLCDMEGPPTNRRMAEDHAERYLAETIGREMLHQGLLKMCQKTYGAVVVYSMEFET